MNPPLIVVTGPIASGKSTVSRVMAARGGALLDADELAHGALADPGCRDRIVAAFGPGATTRGGRISRTGLGRIVFADAGRLDELNRIVEPYVTGIIEAAVNGLAGGDRYIVLDAVLFFQYTFSFEPDLVVLTTAPEETRIRRLIRRNGLSREEARRRIERQRDLEAGWRGADVVIDTGGSMERTVAEAETVRDRFLRTGGKRGTTRWKRNRP